MASMAPVLWIAPSLAEGIIFFEEILTISPHVLFSVGAI